MLYTTAEAAVDCTVVAAVLQMKVKVTCEPLPHEALEEEDVHPSSPTGVDCE